MKTEIEQKIKEASKKVRALTCDFAFQEGAKWALQNLQILLPSNEQIQPEK